MSTWVPYIRDSRQIARRPAGAWASSGSLASACLTTLALLLVALRDPAPPPPPPPPPPKSGYGKCNG